MDEKELDKMAKDIEPIEEPKEGVKTQNSDGFVEDKETYVKPDGETTTAPVRTPNIIKEESNKGKWVFGGLATILILGLGGATAWAYTDAQSVRNELQSVKTGLDTAKTDAAKLRDEVQSLKAKTPEASPAVETITDRAENAALALQDATLRTDDKAGVSKTKGDFVLINSGLPGKDSITHVFKNTKKGLIQIGILSDTGIGGGLPKHEATQLKEQYGFDAMLFDIKIAD